MVNWYCFIQSNKNLHYAMTKSEHVLFQQSYSGSKTCLSMAWVKGFMIKSMHLHKRRGRNFPSRSCAGFAMDKSQGSLLLNDMHRFCSNNRSL
jgi:hypothetical protein